MKISSTLQDNILSLPDNYATLKGIEDDCYQYIVIYQVDPVKALRSNAITVKIHVSSQLEEKINNNLFGTLNAEQILSNIQKSAISIKEQSKANKDAYILTYLSDISSRIPNDQTTQLDNASANNKYVAQTVRTLTTVSAESITSQDKAEPIHTIGSTVFESTDTGNVKSHSINLLTKDNIDPADIGAKTGLITTTDKSLSGLQPSSNAGVMSLANDFSAVGALISSLITSNTNAPTNSSMVKPSGAIVVGEKRNVSYITIIETINIPTSDISNLSDFYLLFELVNNKDTIVSKINVSVPHSRNVASILKPTLAPILGTLYTNSTGKILLSVKQLDRNAKGVKIYRRIYYRSTNNKDASYTYIGKIDLTSSDGEKSLADNLLSTNSIIYRAIPYNYDETLSSAFASIVVSAVQVPYVGNRALLPQISFASLSYEMNYKGILLSIKDLPSDIVSIQFYKQDLTLNQHDKDKVFVGSPVSVASYGNAPIVISDNAVKRNRIYLYTCHLTHRMGHVIECSNSLTIQYLPITNNVVATAINNPRITRNNLQNLDIQFELQTVFIKTQEEQVRATLERQGLSQFFSSFIDKGKLQDLIAYQITRINLTTGQTEDFGVVDSSNFSDYAYGKPKGMKPVETGNEYQYIVSTRLRIPETTLTEYTKDVTYDATPSKDYTYSPAKWQHPITLNEGSLATPQSLNSNYAQSSFTFGDVGDVTTTTVSLTDTLPNINQAQAVKINSSLILIRWHVQGGANKIDHFLIVLEMLGMQTIVGKCHNISDSGYFEFIDSLDDNEKGSLTYSVVPVFCDYNRGNAIKTNSVNL